MKKSNARKLNAAHKANILWSGNCYEKKYNKSKGSDYMNYK